MRIGHGVANPDEGGQELDHLDRVGFPGGSFLVIGSDGLAQGATLHEPHRVVGCLSLAELVDRHNARMLELSRDLGLVQEPGKDDGIAGLIGAQLFERDLAAEAVSRASHTRPMPPLAWRWVSV